MSGTFVVITGLMYLGVAIDQFFKGGVGHSIMFFGYAFANIGIYITAR